VVVDKDPPAAGVVGAAVKPFAAIATDGSNRVVVDAGAGPHGGYLLLLDSFDDDWHVTVDGQDAQMVRANGLFRGVRLVPGQHTVTFNYRPRMLYLGAATSSIASIGIACLLLFTSRATGRALNGEFSRTSAAVTVGARDLREDAL
jgi:hypothetical protein